MLKKIVLFFLLNASIGVAFYQSSTMTEVKDKKTTKSTELALVEIRNEFPLEQAQEALDQEILTSSLLERIERWGQENSHYFSNDHFFSRIFRPESNVFNSAERLKVFEVLQSELLKEIDKSTELYEVRGWSELSKVSSEIRKEIMSYRAMNVMEVGFEKLKSLINDYVDVVLVSDSITVDKESALLLASNLEKKLVDFEVIAQQGFLSRDQLISMIFWHNSLEPQNLKGPHVFMNQKRMVYLTLYALFFVLNSLLLWEMGTKAKGSRCAKNVEYSDLLSAQYFLKSVLAKYEKQKNTYPIKVRRQDDGLVFFTQEMQNEFVEILSNLSQLSSSVGRLSLEKMNNDSVACEIQYSLSENKSLNEELLGRFDSQYREFSKLLRAAQGKSSWGLSYSQEGLQQIEFKMNLASQL